MYPGEIQESRKAKSRPVQHGGPNECEKNAVCTQFVYTLKKQNCQLNHSVVLGSVHNILFPSKILTCSKSQKHKPTKATGDPLLNLVQERKNKHQSPSFASERCCRACSLRSNHAEASFLWIKKNKNVSAYRPWHAALQGITLHRKIAGSGFASSHL